MTSAAGPPGFAAFVARRYDALARTAYLLTGDRGRAEDLVQSALMRTLDSWQRLDAVDAAESYTRTTMVRLAARASRRRWRGEVPTDAVPERSADSGEPDTAMDVRAVLARLPWDQRAVVVLRFLCDLSERETADVLRCRPGTVKSRTNRALAMLRSSGLLTPATTEVNDG